MAKKKLVRLHPQNPRLGRTVANYSYKGQKYIGGLRPQWYVVDEKLAAELAALRQDDSNPASPSLFEVVDEDQKLQLEAQENQQYLAQIGLLQGAVSIPSSMHAPPTHDISTPEAEPEVAPEPAGRSAALPPPRTPTVSETETASSEGGAVTSEAAPKRSKKSRKTSWHEDGGDS